MMFSLHNKHGPMVQNEKKYKSFLPKLFKKKKVTNNRNTEMSNMRKTKAIANQNIQAKVRLKMLHLVSLSLSQSY